MLLLLVGVCKLVEEVKQGILQRILGNPNAMGALAMGFNNMRLRPDPTLNQVIAQRQDNAAKLRASEGVRNRTVETLAKMGYPDLAEAVSNQSMDPQNAMSQAFALKNRAPTRPRQVNKSQIMTVQAAIDAGHLDAAGFSDTELTTKVEVKTTDGVVSNISEFKLGSGTGSGTTKQVPGYVLNAEVDGSPYNDKQMYNQSGSGSISPIGTAPKNESAPTLISGAALKQKGNPIPDNMLEMPFQLVNGAYKPLIPPSAVTNITNTPPVIKPEPGYQNIYENGKLVRQELIPGGAAETEATEQKDEKFEEAKADRVTLDQKLNLLNSVINSPFLDGVLGPVQGRSPGYLNQKKQDLLVEIEQVRAQAFLTAFGQLKGGGSITEAEGRAATAAIGRLDRTQSKAAFRKALNELKALVVNGIEKNKKILSQISSDGFSVNGVIE